MSDNAETPSVEPIVAPVKQKRVRKKKEELTVVGEVVAAVEPVPEVTKTPRKKKYLNNADLMVQIRLSREQDAMTDTLAYMLTLLCDKYAKHPDYANIYSYVDDMKAFAMLTVVKVWRSFNPEKGSNPFAYFTQILRHAFYQYLNHETRHRQVKDVILINMGERPSYTFMENFEEERDYYESEDEDEPRMRRDGREDHTAPGIVTEINYAMGAAPEEESTTNNGEPSEI